MNGAVFLLPLYFFVAWIGATLPFTFIISVTSLFRWEDNIKMDLQEVGGGGDWMELAQDRDGWRALVNTVMNLRGSIKCGEFLD